jgi:hypothetical protein
LNRSWQEWSANDDLFMFSFFLLSHTHAHGCLASLMLLLNGFFFCFFAFTPRFTLNVTYYTPHRSRPNPSQIFGDRNYNTRLDSTRALLALEDLKAPLDGDAFAGVFVIGAEASGVGAKRGVAFGVKLLQRVDALAVDEVNLEMHVLVRFLR